MHLQDAHTLLPGRSADRSDPEPARPGEECVLVLQGGGALGAYQAGVFEALEAAYREPTWVAGISIGAVNAALIAGNPPERRLERLREFWTGVSAAHGPSGLYARPSDDIGRGLANEASATWSLLFGVPGFFEPRLPPPPLQPRGTPAAISWYDTAALRATLDRLVDFDRINDGPMRLSVGAVDVETGNFAYFDTALKHQRLHQHPQGRLDARHVMASGALPPGFPPVEIDGHFYWDGGLVSNTPLQYVLDQPGHPERQRRTVFQVDLFAARGDLPQTLGEVTEREKDIRFSSRTRMNTRFELDREVISQAARRLLAKLPPELQDDPDVQALARLRHCQHAVDVVHLIYRSKHYETQSKDYEFSRPSMLEHWAAGHEDMARTLADPRWMQRPRDVGGVHVFDLTRPPAADAVAGAAA